MSADPADREGGAPPCLQSELIGGHAVDPETARDVARFRRAERTRLIDARRAVRAEERAQLAAAIAPVLDELARPGQGPIISLYWPFRGELDLRAWMAAAHGKGARIALPVVVERAAPLVFRAWTPEARMTRGVWNIPIPADGPEVLPDVVIAPLVGVDAACYRLGYGGGFYDRTLAAMPSPPATIGVGHPSAAIPTIFPQPYDIPMDVVVLGADRVIRRAG